MHITDGVMVDVFQLGELAAGKEPISSTLLDGIDFRDAPYLQAWLDLERHRVRGLTVSLAKEAAVAALATGDAAEAVLLSERLVDLDPLDERHHALLVRSLIAAGDSAGAEQRAEVGARLLVDELGAEQTVLIDAARAIGSGPEHFSSPRSVQALVVAGRAAMGAGVPDAALRTLGGALRDARASGDRTMLSEALIAMAEALIHSVRGLDEIALDLLVEAEAIAAAAGDSARLAAARRELGYTALLRGDYAAADRWFDRAIAAGPGNAEMARLRIHQGCTLIDRGRYDEALVKIEHAVENASHIGDNELLAHALAMLGRAHLHRGDLVGAVSSLERSIEIINAIGWISFRPLPEALLAQAMLEGGRAAETKDMAEGSFVLACEIGDPCWEGLSGHSLALADLDEGNVAAARARLEDAYSRATRVPDSWAWLNGYILAALCGVLVQTNSENAEERLAELEAIAGPANMRDLTDRAAELRQQLAAVG